LRPYCRAWSTLRSQRCGSFPTAVSKQECVH